ncbi:ABC transporter B family member 11-like protein, partial [Tanacetum coccineum]
KDGETICNWKEGTKCLRLLTTNPESWDFWSSGLALHGLLEAIAASTSSPERTHSQLLYDPEEVYAQPIKSQNIYNDSRHEHCSGNKSQRTPYELSISPESSTSHIIISAQNIAFTSSWQLALIVLVLIPIVGSNAYAQMKYGKGYSADAKRIYEEASQIASFVQKRNWL